LTLAAVLAVISRRGARDSARRVLAELLAALIAAVRRLLSPPRPPRARLESGATAASASRGLAAPLAPLVSPVYHPACSLAPAEALARGGGFAWGGGAHVGARSEQQDVLGVVWPGCARQTSAGGLALASLAGWPALTAGGKPAGVVTSFHVVCDGHGKHGRAVARFVTDQLGRALRDAARVLGAGASAEAAFEAAFLALDAELLAADAWLRAGAAAEPREGDAPAAADLAAGERAARELTRLVFE
jgi:hypothetical protein